MPPREQGFERIMDDRYCLFLGPTPMFTNVMRLRLAPEQVASTVEEIREHVRGRGRREAEWWVGESATPPDLVERLLTLGLRPADTPPNEPELAAMAQGQLSTSRSSTASRWRRQEWCSPTTVFC